MLSICTQAQISKVESYQVGTQIDYYIGQCGNAIPEAQGKLSFCDREGNLGVVENSLGLNGNGTERLIDNHFDDSEMYLTRNGVSIRKSNGDWENIPNVAFAYPNFASFNNTGRAVQGVALPDGRLIMVVNQIGPFLHAYDFNTKALTTVPTPNQESISKIVYDASTGRVFLIMTSVSETHIAEFVNNNIIIRSTLNSTTVNNLGFTGLGFSTSEDAAADGVIYIANSNGLFAIDVNAGYNITKYDNTDTGILPTDRTTDVKVVNGIIWLSQADVNDGGVVRLDPTNNTTTVYNETYFSGATELNYKIDALAIGDDGTIYAAPQFNTFGGIFEIDPTDPNAPWTVLTFNDLSALGVPIIYSPTKIYNVDGSIYYLTNTFSTGNPDENEVIIRDDNSWTGRNDDAPGNISVNMISRYNHALPKSDGGSLWINNLDGIIVDIDASNSLASERRFNVAGSSGALDSDDNYVNVLREGNSSFETHKVVTPTLYQYATNNNGGNRSVSQYNDQIWVYNQSAATIEIYINDSLIQSYDLDPAVSLASYFRTVIDTQGIFWSAKNDINNMPKLLRFDKTTEALTEIQLTTNITNVQSMLPSPDGGIWIISNASAVFYKNGIEYGFPSSLFNDSANAGTGSIQNGVVDTNGKLHLMISASGFAYEGISTIENPTNANPVVGNLRLTNNASPPGLLPTEDLNSLSRLLIDADGDYWINLEKGFFQLTDSDLATSFRTEGITNGIISGRLYGDINQNTSYDDGEGIAGVSVAVEVNGEVQNTITNAEGIYRLFISEENTAHTITVTSVGDEYYLANRIQILNVATVDQNYENNDFILEVKDYESLLFKQGQRQGVWGFDRDGFENTFTLAITNMSLTKTFNQLASTFLFENENGGDLPQIIDVKFTKLDPNDVTLLHRFIAINPVNNRWSLPEIPPSAYSRTEITLSNTTITEETGKRRVNFIIPAISPRDTWIIEVRTALFDPAQTGTGIVFTTESVNSPSFNDYST